MDERIWLQEVSEKIKKKMLSVVDRNVDKVPYKTVNGIFDDWTDKNICWWTNGFWGGILWQMYNATGIALYREEAEKLEKKQDKNLLSYQDMDHDSGFRWLPTAVANYRLTGNEDSKNRGMLAADNLAGRFNPVGKFLRAWNFGNPPNEKAGWAIIDCMMNLPLLYWAYEESGDPRYIHIATLHGDTAMQYFVREDGSVKHIIEFDPVTGEYLRSRGGQGYRHGSSWTRGQSWAIYGFVLSYIHTKKEQYLNCAKKVAQYFIANTPANYLIPVDFRQPEEPHWEDSTAAAIAACGMIELAKYSKDVDKKMYYEAAIHMLKALDDMRCNWSADVDNILEKCTVSYHDEEHEVSIIYGDYYFIEAIWKLTNQELFIW